ncbi:MAG TPA: hypothetical protein VIV11_17630 [Kofleriaceae bacterium]
MRKLLLVITVSACVSPTEPKTGGLEQGLTIFQATPERGVAGMYAKGELAVFFETKRELEPEPAVSHEQFAIDGSAINVSARFTDMEGRNLLVSLARHDAPAEWVMLGEPSQPMRDARPALFDLALEAGNAIDAANLDPTIAAEARALVVTGVNMRPPTAAPPPSVGETAYSDGWDHYQYFEVRSASCCGIAEHSATVFWNWSESAGWEDGWQTNNHGRWATEMGLEGDCGGTGAWSGGGRPHYWSDRLQYCDMQNGYNVCGPFGGNHNCHDDTKMQRANIVYGAWYGSAPGFCSGWGCDVYAPNCY